MIPIARAAHPFTPATVALALSAAALLAPPPHGTAAVLLLVTVLAIVSGTPRAVLLAAGVCLPFWLLLFVMHGVLGEAPRDTQLLGLSLSTAGLVWALEQGLRLGAIVTASFAFAASFDPHRFLQAAIERGWRFDVAFVVVATLDAADRLGEQARRLREAQRSRGLRLHGSMLSRARTLPALIFPLMLVSVMEADDRALALESRGLTLPGKRTAIDPPDDRAADQVVRWSAGVLVLMAAWWRFA